MSGLVWLALDGVGHPLDAPPDSPWDTDLPHLRPLVDGGLALDARLGVAGLPQSATGQTSWLTGQNAAAVMGEHFGPQPGPTLRSLLEDSLPVRLAGAGGRVELVKVYPPPYFQRPRLRHGCFPLSLLLAGRTLNPAGFSLISPTLGLAFEPPSGETASTNEVCRWGEQLGRQAGEADLLILDLWFSDVLGHRGGPQAESALLDAARTYLRHLDALLSGLLEEGAPVILTSDHGNFEDLRVKTHTLARVPFAGHGLPAPLPTDVSDIVAGGRAVAALLGLQEGSLGCGPLEC